jgi:alanyl-tRNA synthetase
VRVVSESAVGAGARRIEALTGEGARAYLATQDDRIKALANTLKVTPAEVISRVEGLVEERRRLERELTEARKKLALAGDGGASAGGEGVREVNGVKFLGRTVSGVEPRDLKGLADEGKKSLGSGVVTFIGVAPDGKASVVVAVTDDLKQTISAIDLVRTAASVLGGKGGGGRPDMAQAGGPDGAKAPQAIEAVAESLAN